MLYLNLIVDGSRKQLVAGVIESHRGDLVGVVDGVGRTSLPYVPHLVFGGRKGLINGNISYTKPDASMLM